MTTNQFPSFLSLFPSCLLALCPYLFSLVFGPLFLLLLPLFVSSGSLLDPFNLFLVFFILPFHTLVCFLPHLVSCPPHLIVPLLFLPTLCLFSFQHCCHCVTSVPLLQPCLMKTEDFYQTDDCYYIVLEL